VHRGLENRGQSRFSKTARYSPRNRPLQVNPCIIKRPYVDFLLWEINRDFLARLSRSLRRLCPLRETEFPGPRSAALPNSRRGLSIRSYCALNGRAGLKAGGSTRPRRNSVAHGAAFIA
jgi:hypothetical protein